MSTLARPVSYGPSSAVEPAQDRRLGPAFWTSSIAHGAALAALLFFTYALREKIDAIPPVFEVVAGEGNAFDAKEAPSGHEAGLAAEGAVEFTSPTPAPTWTPPAPAPMEAVSPAEATPAPVAPVTPVTKVEPVKPAPKVDPVPVPNFKNAVSKTIRRQEKKADKEIQAQRDADAKAAAAEAKRAATSYAEFQKQQGSKSTKSTTASASAGGTAAGPRVDASGIRKGVTGANGANREGAGGKALAADGGASLDRYFAMLIERLRSSHEKPGGLSDLLSAEVEFSVAANGAMTGVRITRSSGNSDFDQSVLETFSRVRSVGPRPDGKTDVRSLTFRMKEI